MVWDSHARKIHLQGWGYGTMGESFGCGKKRSAHLCVVSISLANSKNKYAAKSQGGQFRKKICD